MCIEYSGTGALMTSPPPSMPGKKMITYGSHGATRAVANFIGAECTPEPCPHSAWDSAKATGSAALFEQLDNNVASTARIDFDQSLFCLHCHDLSSGGVVWRQR